MSRTQLPQEIFNLFDRIIVLGNGYFLFQGSHQDAVPYFAKLGFTEPLHVWKILQLEMVPNTWYQTKSNSLYPQ
ncbi:conserved hypothetical protein [Ricinus communis]|uniref:Uncharacterized protein n=1 Tax=Ricinus communis TaxID=3988 RepID=B9RFP3_RICCO|nr:conserved hypothetical protein [Ricinus communis]